MSDKLENALDKLIEQVVISTLSSGGTNYNDYKETYQFILDNARWIGTDEIKPERPQNYIDPELGW